MAREDYEILEELLETIELLQERRGIRPARDHRSSLETLQRDVADFSDACRRDVLKGQARRRRSGQLFRRILSLEPLIWER